MDQAERRLWGRVLILAALDCWNVGPCTGRKREEWPSDESIDVLDWLDDETNDAPGSFRYCCFAVGLDSGSVRRFIKSRFNAPIEERKVIKWGDNSTVNR